MFDPEFLPHQYRQYFPARRNSRLFPIGARLVALVERAIANPAPSATAVVILGLIAGSAVRSFLNESPSAAAAATVSVQDNTLHRQVPHSLRK